MPRGVKRFPKFYFSFALYGPRSYRHFALNIKCARLAAPRHLDCLTPMIEKSMDRKLAALHADYDCGEFILADAKDADMAFGIAGPGKSPERENAPARWRSLDEYRASLEAGDGSVVFSGAR